MFLNGLGGGLGYDSSNQPRPPVKPEYTDNQSGDNRLIYYYACGTDLETDQKIGTGNLHGIQNVKLPDNVKVLIQTGGTKK